MVEFLFGAAKVYIIVGGALFVLVLVGVVWVWVSVVRDMKKMDREMDKWKR